MVTEISEDSVTAFYIFFLIKNYQRILDPNPLTQFSIFFVPQLLTKSLNFSYLEVLDFKDFLSSVGSRLRENAEIKGNFLILGVHFII